MRARREFIVTFNPEATVRPSFIPTLLDRMRALGGRVEFVAITCPEEVIEERLASSSRFALRKLTSVAAYRELRAQHAFDFPPLFEPVMGLPVMT